MKAKTHAQWSGFVAVFGIGCFVLVATRSNSTNILLLLAPLLVAASAVMRAIGFAIDAIREPSDNKIEESSSR